MHHHVELITISSDAPRGQGSSPLLAEVMHSISVSTGPGPGPGPLQSNITSVRSQNIFWTGHGLCIAFALLFLFISHQPHFTSATKKV